jgi:hypothetical protein
VFMRDFAKLRSHLFCVATTSTHILAADSSRSIPSESVLDGFTERPFLTQHGDPRHST